MLPCMAVRMRAVTTQYHRVRMLSIDTHAPFRALQKLNLSVKKELHQEEEKEKKKEEKKLEPHSLGTCLAPRRPCLVLGLWRKERKGNGHDNGTKLDTTSFRFA